MADNAQVQQMANDDNNEQSLSERDGLFQRLDKIAREMTLNEAERELPATLSRREIHQEPILFQPREIIQQHIGDLVKALKRDGGRLDPVTVMQIGGKAYLIDGHHRMEAYRLAKVHNEIPVSWFKGTVTQAVEESARANSKAKLGMIMQDRMDCAWRLVLDGKLSKAATARAANVSLGQVDTMRKIKKALGEDAHNHEAWSKASRAVKNLEETPQWSAEDIEAMLEMRAEQYAEKMRKTFSNKLVTNPEIAARTFKKHFGSYFVTLWRDMRGLIDDTELTPEEIDDADESNLPF